MSAVPALPKEVHDINNSGLEDEGLDGVANGNKPGKFDIRDEPVDHHRNIKAIVIGAGFSGIYAGIRIPERIKNVELVIYEKNAGIGGTWFENRYPGCACDVPSHSYQYSFNPNPKWSALYAPAPEIRAYLEDTAKKYSVERFVKLSHKVHECKYLEKEGKWRIRVENCLTNEFFDDNADVLIQARGLLNEMQWPSIPGFESFKGEVMHSAKWNQSYDFKNKKIGIIGSGSSSIQIVPQLQRLTGTQLSVFVRNRTWISPPFGQSVWDNLGIKDVEISPEQREEFVNDPEKYEEFRRTVEIGGNEIQDFTFKGTTMQQGAREFFEESMKSRLADKPEIFKELVPGFAPGCRRLTPGPGYLEALTQPNVEFVTSGITGIEPEGLVTEDGSFHEIDVLVCATGFETSAPPPYPVFGRGGKLLKDHWSRFPKTYLSLGTNEFPNQFLMLGPNSGIGAGSLTMMMEASGDYITKCIRKMQKENIKSMVPKRERVDDFVEYAMAYFEHTVYTDSCRSWYKNKHGEVTGLWPGSSMHFLETLQSPRWEDWEYESLEDVKSNNKLAWLGNGWTDNQKKHDHLAWYLYPEHLDIPTTPYPEKSKKYAAKPFAS